MLHVVAYDIPDDTRRARVADTLKDFGRRVQYSVFEAVLDQDLAERLRRRLLPLIDADTDSVRIYRLCAGCEGLIEVLGQGERTQEPDLLVV